MKLGDVKVTVIVKLEHQRKEVELLTFVADKGRADIDTIEGHEFEAINALKMATFELEAIFGQAPTNTVQKH